MKIAGIVSEYNPFHNGHAYQIEQTRNLGATHIVAVMSPNFVQRGECAVFDKFTRANVAVKNGVDLVVELPTPYALSSAEFFAQGAIKVLNSMGCIDMLSFGSESGDISQLKQTMKIIETDEYKQALKEFLKSGVSFPKAQTNAVEKVYSKELSEIIKKPNNLLGIEYLKALNKINSNITAVTIKRKGVEHDDDKTCENFASASKIREELLSQSNIITQKFLPCNGFDDYKQEISKKNAPILLENAQKVLIYKLRNMKREDFLRLADVSEGLENKIISAAAESDSLNELLEKIKNKRYTMARIKRIVCCAFNDIPATLQKEYPPYIRILAFNERGQEILKKMNDTATVPFSTSLMKLSKENELCKEFADVESRCTDNFLLCSSKIFKKGYDYTTKVAIMK